MSNNLNTWLMSTPVHLLRYLRQELLGETSSDLGCVWGGKTDWVKLREDELCTGAFLFLCYCYWAYVGLNQKTNCSSRTECWFQFPPLKGSWGMAIKISHFLILSAWSSAALLLAVSACSHEVAILSMPRKQTFICLWHTHLLGYWQKMWEIYVVITSTF